MDDWQCCDKSIRYLWRLLCEIINLSSMRSPISGQMNHFEAPALKFTTRGICVCNCFCPAEDLSSGSETHPLRHRFPKFKPLPSPHPTPPPCILPLTPCASLSFPRPLPHCTACSLAVLPESWGFMTSGSSGGVEKDSILSCSNESSEDRERERERTVKSQREDT